MIVVDADIIHEFDDILMKMMVIPRNARCYINHTLNFEIAEEVEDYIRKLL